MRALLFASFALVPLALVACNKENPEFCKTHPGVDGCPGMMIDGGGGDADTDADTIDARLGYGEGEYAVALPMPAQGTLNFTGTPISTAASSTTCNAPSSWTSGNQPDTCFVVATNINVSSLVRVTGPRPLVLLATNNLTITGTLDAAGHLGGATPGAGPGAPFTNCISPTGNLQSSSGGGDGGAGASFMSRGGNNGGGDGRSSSSTAAQADAANPLRLRAGCTGQSASGTAPGAGGFAGGAVVLMAGNTIDITTGIVNASGGGGGAPGGKSGGGGGGTGGMIAIYAPTIMTGTGTRLAANGGGGASGGTGGQAGGETDPTTPSMAAQGGSSCSTGGDGNASAAAQTGGNGGSNCGGGGGGGGGGYIWISMDPAMASGQFSPAPKQGP
jgi:hypothetical protein